MSVPPDFSVAQDLSQVDFRLPIDLASVDLTGVDLTSVDLTQPDLSNVDLYMPLFKPAASYSAETGPIYLAAADLNKDGKRDLIVVNTNTPTGAPAVPSSVNVLLGVGDGTFQTKMSTNIDNFPFGIAVADINGDMNADLVIALYDGYDVLLGTGNGSFGMPSKVTVSTAIRSVALGDLDGDNILDVVLADRNANTGKVWVGRGTGTGTFNTAVSFEVSTVTTGDIRHANVVRLADMNGDGKLDVVTSNTTPTVTVNSISILTNSSTVGTVALSTSPIELTTALRPRDMVLAQLDGANKTDIVVANAGSDSIGVYLSDTASSAVTFAAPVSYPTGTGSAPFALAFADIDGDTKPDVVTANSFNNSVTVLYGGVNGVFNQATAARPGSESYPVGNNPISIVTGTFNADVKIDVATANQVSKDLSVLINQR